ncbi:hypothetical protein HYX70_00975 [Candidatus Saccharibacteria bacterium]|nr:hypothetical protein [Candidatus Saccharibacteria bacterium]
MKSVVFLEEATNVNEVGGKGASLGRMTNAGLAVPPGFVITTASFNKSLVDSNGLTKEIYAVFDKLGAERVAVRSSAIAEDAAGASWAGQLDTELNVDRGGLLDAIKHCWQSIESDRAQSYAKDHHIPKKQQAVAVVVQKMVDSEVSGVMFTANPLSSNPEQMVIEAIHGLGELLVQGLVTPEGYTVDKKTGSAIYHTKHRQAKMLVYKDGKNTEAVVTKKGQILSKALLQKLVEQGKQIEDYYDAPQDIEFAIENQQIYIVQSRPITTLNSAGAELPEFFSHCVKTIARPATLQRDEIVRFTSNIVAPVDVVTIPVEGTTRAYYLEAGGSKKILGLCLEGVNTKKKLNSHLDSYNKLKEFAQTVIKFVEDKPSNYEDIFTRYREFLTKLSVFLYTGVAIDAILYPKFKEYVETKFASKAQRVIDIVATPKALHDYQKMRLELCRLKVSDTTKQELKIKLAEIAKTFKHVPEYSFVEPLLTPGQLKNELQELTETAARAEIEEINNSIDDSQQGELQQILPEPYLTQALAIKEYALLRTDRIDQLKRVQTTLREVFAGLAKELSQKTGKDWTVEHIANLLDVEIDGFVKEQQAPSFQQTSKRLDQQYLYYYTDSKAIVELDQNLIEKAKTIIASSAKDKGSSLISPGTTAFAGTAEGRVVRIASKSDLSKVKRGDIIVAHVTMPDYTPAMKLAAGFITAEGGITSHAAIVARELQKPCIVGSDNCMKVLKDGDYISLNAGAQVVNYAQQDYLGEPDELFYWGPSRAKPLYMSDFMSAAEEFFVAAHNNPEMPNPPKTLALFYKGKNVWLINAQKFAEFTERTFEAYQKQNRFNTDRENWQKLVESLDKQKADAKDLAEAQGLTVFAEFALYGAESAVAKMLDRLQPKQRQQIWGGFTLPDKPTFLSKIDDELIEGGDPKALAEKYPWIDDGYRGVNNKAEAYFKKRLPMLKDSYGSVINDNRTKREELADKYKLAPKEVGALNLARKLAEFMDDRKAWMMRTRREIKKPASKVKDGWFYHDGKVDLIGPAETEDLWERYVDFKASTTALNGLVASNGGRHFVNGEVVIVASPTDPVPDDHVIVVPASSPSYVPLMRKARAMVTDHGGMMSHAAIVGREFNLPCIVGTKQATKVLKTGDKIVLDLVKGEVNK